MEAEPSHQRLTPATTVTSTGFSQCPGGRRDGSDGDIFVLDMGEPVKIVDLAREMITLSGLRPGEDIEIVFSGVRPGEKLYEELSVKGEDISPTRHEKIYVWRNRKEDWPRVCEMIDRLVADADRLSLAELKERLSEVVPEYAPEQPKENSDNLTPSPDHASAASARVPSPAKMQTDFQIGESPVA